MALKLAREKEEGEGGGRAEEEGVQEYGTGGRVPGLVTNY